MHIPETHLFRIDIWIDFGHVIAGMLGGDGATYQMNSTQPF